MHAILIACIAHKMRLPLERMDDDLNFLLRLSFDQAFRCRGERVVIRGNLIDPRTPQHQIQERYLLRILMILIPESGGCRA